MSKQAINKIQGMKAKVKSERKPEGSFRWMAQNQQSQIYLHTRRSVKLIGFTTESGPEFHRVLSSRQRNQRPQLSDVSYQLCLGA